MKSGTHYHILGSSKSSLDWKAFPTDEEAAQTARSIKKPDERYMIVERDGECERCKEFKSKAHVAFNDGRS